MGHWHSLLITAMPPLLSSSILRRQNIRFNQGVAGGVIFAAHNGGGIAGRTNDDDGGLLRIGRSFAARLNLGLLIGRPIVVSCKRCWPSAPPSESRH
jgi:hypothetical protein